MKWEEGSGKKDVLNGHTDFLVILQLCLLQESSSIDENQYDDSNIPKVINDIGEDTLTQFCTTQSSC